jgi:CHAT domain-containing protein
LFKIPFEALVRENHRFLAEDVAISYHWSGALWQQARAKAATTSYSTSYGGFAPEYRTKAALASVMGAEVTDLPEAREAVRASGAAWKGQVWTGDTIDEALFLREAGKYGVLHLAMHGVMDPNERTKTGLLFPNQSDSIDLLNALKISQMELHAQIAILSACNTASGKVYRGEGVMSLSRAFALAGCPTVVANLWEVPSQETNAIAAQFLEFLRDGKSKDVALQQAKQAYLASAMPERRHPYFWAGQVLTGHEEPIQQSSKGILFWILMLVLGLILGYGLMVLRRK